MKPHINISARFFQTVKSLFMAVCLVLFCTSVANAQSLNCEALAEMKPSDSVNINPKVIESCIMNGFDPPRGWRELGGLGRGATSASGAITPTGKCRGDGKCASYSTAVTAYFDNVTTAPVDCTGFRGPDLFKTVINAVGLSGLVNCNSCFNNFIENITHPALDGRGLTIPCIGGSWKKADEIATPCTPAQPSKFYTIPTGGAANEGKGLTCGGSIQVGPEKVSLVTDARYVAETIPRTGAGTFNKIKIYKNREVPLVPGPGTKRVPGAYDDFQTIDFNFRVYIFPRVFYDVVDADTNQRYIYGKDPVVAYCDRALPIRNYNANRKDYQGDIVTSLSSMNSDITSAISSCVLTSAPDDIEIFPLGAAPSCRRGVYGDEGRIERSGTPPATDSPERWERYWGSCGPRLSCWRYRSLIPPHGASAANHPNHPGQEFDPLTGTTGLPHGYWNYNAADGGCEPVAKQLTIDEELISVDDQNPFFAVRYKNSQLYAFFEYNALSNKFEYKLMGPHHESGLNEPQINMNGVRITYPVEDNTCTFSHLPAPVPCANYMLTVNRDKRLLILPPDRKTYEAPNDKGKLVPVAPQNEPLNSATHDPALFTDPAMLHALNGDVTNIKLMAARNPEETVAIFPEDTKLEVFGDAQILLMDGGILVRDDGEHITIPPAGMLDFRKVGATLQVELSQSNVGVATVAGDEYNAVNDPTDPNFNVTGTTITYNPRPYHPDNYLNEKGMQQKYVENPLYPEYPAVVFPHGAVKFLSGNPAAASAERNLDLVFPVTWKSGAGLTAGEIVLPNGDPYVVAVQEVVTQKCENDPAKSRGDAPNQHCAMYVFFTNTLLRYPNWGAVAAEGGGYRLPFDGNMSETYELAQARTGCTGTWEGARCPDTACKSPPCTFTQAWDDQTASPSKAGRKAYALAKNTIVSRDVSGLVYTGNGVKVGFNRSDRNQYEPPSLPSGVSAPAGQFIFIWRSDFFPKGTTAPPPAIEDDSVKCSPGVGSVTPPAGYRPGGSGTTADGYAHVDGSAIECRTGVEDPNLTACTAPNTPVGCEWKALPVCTFESPNPCKTVPNNPVGCTQDLPLGCQRRDRSPIAPIALPPICDHAGLPAGCRTM